MFNTEKKSKGEEVVRSLAYWVLLFATAFLPIFILSTNSVPTLMTKAFFGGSLVFATLFFFAVAHMRKQEIAIPRSLILGSAWGVPLAYVLSTLFAPRAGSLFGERLIMDSTVFILIVFAAVTVSALLLDTSKRALGMYFAMLTSAVLLTVSELYLFYSRFKEVQATGAATGDQTLSLVGSLNDLGIFFGLIAIFLILSLIMLPVTNMIRTVLWGVLIASLYFLAVVNLTALWWIVGAFALAFLVHSVTDAYSSSSGGDSKKVISFASAVVLIVAVVFIFVPTRDAANEPTITGKAATALDIGEFDIRPSWKTTVSLGSESFAENGAIFGAGPGSFYYVWSKHLPESINTSAFWLTDFFYGIGFVPTTIISTGILGAFAWLLFFGVFLWRGSLHLIRRGDVKKGDIAGYVRVTSFVAALYLWITTVIMVPSPALLIFAGLFTGTFIASLGFNGDAKQFIQIQFRKNPQIGFVSTLALTLIALLSIGGIFGLYTRYSAEATYREAVVNREDIDASYALVSEAIEKNELDIYYRFKSNLDAVRIQNLMAENRAPEEIREEFEGYLQDAIANGLKATKLDKRDYQNWSNLGNVYQSIVPLGVEGAVDSALTQYDNALTYRPKSPSIYYAKAVLERSRGDNVKAREYIEKAITLRNQYTDAIFLLAQLQIEEEEVEQAINSVKAITLFSPKNAVAHFQLGLLYYSEESFVNAARSLERAVSIDGDYANARYFLALSYWKLGDDAKALEQFRKVQETNTENAELVKIIENLEAGKDPFAHLNEDPRIENRAGLPISDIGDGSKLNVDLDELAE